jgi:uncharacterized protein (TIGR00255 family)
MISSMTGYGESQGETDGVTYVVEIRALNNRYLKTNIKLPDTAAFLEEALDKLLRENLSRGTINYVLRLKGTSANMGFEINETILQSYVEKLTRIATGSAEADCQIDIASLLAIPGILEPVSPNEETAAKIREMVLKLSKQALEQLKQMRLTEGAALAADLENHCKATKQVLEKIIARREVVLQEYKNKLQKRVNALLASAKLELDEDTLAREVAVFADRADISEEIARLDSHLQQFADSCQTNNKAGRRLDFICQEMLREANTIASKTSDTEIAHWVVDIKCQIDRIKEQVQNIE